MKKLIVLVALSIAVLSCKNDSKKETSSKEKIAEKVEKYPADLAKVFAAHGGLDTWKKVQVLSFNKGEEIHTVALKSRKTVINHPDYAIGFDGKEVWLNEIKKGAYKGNPNFYYNLFFYFYAMPFVLADDGIIYDKVDAITYNNRIYPGIKISYKANVGTSPDDNYIIYYDSETYKMSWLAYTVTFKSKKPSEKYNLIRYGKWNDVNGLLLPEEITWYKTAQNGNPLEASRPGTKFTLPLASQAKLADSFFSKPVN